MNCCILEENDKTRELGYNDDSHHTNGELLAINNFISFGSVVFDIGANRGEWSAKVINQDKHLFALYLFEPLPECFNSLLANSLFSNCVLTNKAVCNKTGIAKFFCYPDIPVLSTMYRRAQDIEDRYHLFPQEITVQTVTIDQFCKENHVGCINFLKIDTEGAEADVLEGSVWMLQESKIRAIQFEYGGCYKDAGRSLQAVFSFLEHFGFKLFRLCGKGLIRINKWESYLENYQLSNYLAVLGAE